MSSVEHHCVPLLLSNLLKCTESRFVLPEFCPVNSQYFWSKLSFKLVLVLGSMGLLGNRNQSRNYEYAKPFLAILLLNEV